VTDNSQRAYAEHVARLPAYFAAVGYPGVYCASMVTRELVRAYKERAVGIRGRLKGRPLAPTTRAMDLSLLKAFLAHEGAPLALETRLFRVKGARPSRRAWMEGKEAVAALLNAAPRPDAQAAFCLMVYGGLRSAEARAVTVADLELPFDGHSRVVVRSGKGGKPGEVILPPLARNCLLNAIHGKGPTDRVYPWGRSHLARDVELACARAGLRRYTPHDLRRTFARLLRRAGLDLATRQKQMRHADVSTTIFYEGEDPEMAEQGARKFEEYLAA
jgi:integrase